MPYVEVWVEPEVNCRQAAALSAIVRVCRMIAASGALPTADADALDRAILDLVKEFPGCETSWPEFPADHKYKKWLNERKAAAE